MSGSKDEKMAGEEKLDISTGREAGKTENTADREADKRNETGEVGTADDASAAKPAEKNGEIGETVGRSSVPLSRKMKMKLPLARSRQSSVEKEESQP
jgi:hypothetical protein